MSEYLKRVYFVRHGETVANRKRVHQGPDESLSLRGKKQAERVSQILKNLNIDTLACSPLVRARETAEIIGRELNLPLSIIEGVEEFRRPDHLYGQSHFSPDSLKYIWSLYWHRKDPKWDNDRAENLIDVRNRILDVQNTINNLPGERIVIISHAIFIDMFTQMVCADRDLKLREFIHGLLLAKKLPNTGMVAFDIDQNAPQGTCRWWFAGSGQDISNQRVDYRQQSGSI